MGSLALELSVGEHVQSPKWLQKNHTGTQDKCSNCILPHRERDLYNQFPAAEGGHPCQDGAMSPPAGSTAKYNYDGTLKHPGLIMCHLAASKCNS